MVEFPSLQQIDNLSEFNFAINVLNIVYETVILLNPVSGYHLSLAS